MNDNTSLHVLLLDDDYAVTSWATSASMAVQHHFNTMDAYCPPSSDFEEEETSVKVFSIPRELEDDLTGEIEDLDGDDLAETVLELANKHPNIRRETVNFSYKNGDLCVSPT